LGTRAEGYLGITAKDIDCVMEEGIRHQAYLPLTSAAHEVFNIARRRGLGKYDEKCVYRVWEEAMNMRMADAIRR